VLISSRGIEPEQPLEEDIMKLRGIDFGNVLGASGVQGFFGEGYWFHRLWRPFGLDLSDLTFVAKTATMWPRSGNMALKKNFEPRNLFPSCVKVKPWRGLVLNAVGLSNPGLLALLARESWQKRTKPFWLSLMPMGNTANERLEELRTMVNLIGLEKENFSAPFGLQINLSCPNTNHDPGQLIEESDAMLNVAGTLGVPLMLKFSIASAPIEAVAALNDHAMCDAICVSNTLPFGWQGIDWQNVWGGTTSPLAEFGGGGLSGGVLRPLVCKWMVSLRKAGFTKPINGGGGILCADDVDAFNRAGASSIFIGSVAMVRPWRVKSIIKQANKLDWR